MTEYAKRVGVISLKQKTDNPTEKKFQYLYDSIGWNTGNLMFTNAVYRHIDGDLSRIGFSFDPKMINNNFDALVVPAANWINEQSNWDEFISLLEKVEIPVITLGIGLQAGKMDLNKVRVNESSVRLIKLLSQKSKWISCRGYFTRDWLASIGIKNVVATGCPSIYMKFDNTETKYPDADSVVLQSTRFWITSYGLDENNIHRKIYALAGRLNLPMVYQSEVEEIDYIIYAASGADEHARRNMKELIQIYEFASEIDMKQYLTTKGRVFFDIDQWSSYIKNNLGVIGTRLHGSIVALNSNRPARLITHDSRTQEVAEFAEIPQLLFSDIATAKESELINILKNTDTEKYSEAKKRSSTLYRQFLEDCGLCPKYSEIAIE